MKKNSNYIITPQKVLSDTEIKSLNILCTRLLDSPRDRRNALILLLALECGLRASEALGILIEDYDFKNKNVYIRALKGSMPRVLPVRGSLCRSIEKMLLEAHNVERVDKIPRGTKIFDISYSRLEQVWRFYRPNPHKTLHSLRHTFAVKTYLRTRDIILVQNALGHRQIDNTMVYVNYVYSQTALRSALVIGE